MKLKELNKSLVSSFERLKQDINDLKKAKNILLKEVNELNLKHNALYKDAAKNEDIHKMQMKVENVAYEQKGVKETVNTVETLKNEAILKREYTKKMERMGNEIKALRQELLKLRKSRDVVRAARINELEKSLLKIDDVKKLVMKDVKRQYLTAEEVAGEINPLKKEFLDLYHKVNKIKRDVLDYPRMKWTASMLIMIGVVSFAGAAIGLYFGYDYAANFLGVQAVVFFIAGIFVRLWAALKA